MAEALLLLIKARLRSVIALILALACCGCTGRPLQGVLVPAAQSAPGISRVPILVATTRQRSTTDPGDMFSGNPAQELSYASITISIPPDGARKIGQVQWPTSLPGDPTRDFVTASAEYLDKQSFNTAISTLAKSTGRSRALVFVHGFNNRFDEAVYRLAQIVQDSKAPVIPILFSWPSKGLVQLDAYKYDVQSANESRAALRQLIGAIALNPSVKEVTILCHSMGCWPALEALRSNSIHVSGSSGKVKNILLVAADVDVDVFRTEVQQMGRPKPRIALFVSRDDQALKISKSIWGKIRLGDANLDHAYWTDFERQGIMVFDLTNLEGNAHSRAFEDVTSVMGMIERRLAEGQQLAESVSNLSDSR
jgi:esterase/lipase superfamily enzyme